MTTRLARLATACLLLSAAAGCGGDDDEPTAETSTSASEQAEQTPGKAVRCGQRSFRVAFDPQGAIVVAAGDDTLASVTETQQTVSGRCTLTREEGPFDQGQLVDRSSEVVTLSCNVREPPDIVVRGTNVVIAVRPQAIVTATAGDSIQWSNVCSAADEPAP